MKVGILGLGIIGYSISQSLYGCGYEVKSWSRRQINVPWHHSIETKDIRLHKLDALIVASGLARPNFGTYETEYNSTLRILESIGNELNVGRIYYLSSGSVYGDCPSCKFENSSVLPLNDYGRVKLQVERDFHEKYSGKLTVLRIGNIVDWLNPYGIISKIKALKNTNGGHIEVIGKLDDCRDYIGVVDFNAVLKKILESSHEYEIINIGSGNSMSLGTILDLLQLKFENNLTLTCSNQVTNTSFSTRLDVERMKSISGILPKFPMTLLREYLFDIN